MKTLFAVTLLLTSFCSYGQYYYKDIIGTKETEQLINTYQANKVSRVVVNSYDADGTRSDDFLVEQQFAPAAHTLTTITRSDVTDASVLTSYINADGRVIKTVDSSENMVSTTLYQYDNNGLLTSVISTSIDSAHGLSEKEAHLWQYDAGKAVKMLRIKNDKDTTFVTLKLDDKGNVIEEQSIRNNQKNQPVYYYYDSKGRLTDIVRYSNKAKRLLPEYMFEYSPADRVIQKITVPANSSDYLIWRYQYNDKGLKTKEAVYNKQKQLTGTVQYQYQFGS